MIGQLTMKGQGEYYANLLHFLLLNDNLSINKHIHL